VGAGAQLAEIIVIMCGICGVAYPDHHPPISEERLIEMRDILTHRGPDDAGVFMGPGIALGSRRLAILDLSARGRMPMTTPEGRYHIAYNGEIYNYRELRDYLRSKGCTFRSDTDTEMLLRLYELMGPSMLERLNGMFAIAIWDTQSRRLFLARDRLGVKPLYYAEYRGAFYFASEQKALFAAGVPASFDRETWEELLCFRYVAGERTPLVGVKRLLPGHTLTWEEGKIHIRRWWNLSERTRHQRESLPSKPHDWFRETFDDAVDLRRISDVPVGVLLSGGLDSGSIAASLAMQAGGGVDSFTVRFDESGYDEGPLARAVAERWRLNVHEIRISPEELFNSLGYASWLNDEPLAHGSDVHLWAVARHAKPHVTVLLSGEGADESLAGYVRYRPLRYPGLLKPARAVLTSVGSGAKFSGRTRKLLNFLQLGSVRDFVLFNACDTLPAQLQALGIAPTARFAFREKIVDEASTLYPKSPMRQAMYSDQHTFLCSLLDRNDRMTMGASIECRVPFLDYRLIEGLAALPSSLLYGRVSKPLLRRATGDRLPEQVLQFKKWGFGVPWRRYLREVPVFRERLNALPSHEIIREGPFAPLAVQTLVNRFSAGDDTAEPLIKQLLATTIWHDASCHPRRTSVRHGTRRESPRLAVS